MPNRKHFSYADLDHWLDERQVTEIESLVPDLTGVARGKILPRAKFADERGMRIPEAVLGMTVTGNYPSDDAAYLRVISALDRDMVLRADPATIALVPWAADPAAQVIHDCYFADGNLVDFAPRSVLRRVLKLYAMQGWAPLVRPELEFYLSARNVHPDQPLKPAPRPATSNCRRACRKHCACCAPTTSCAPCWASVSSMCTRPSRTRNTANS